MPDDGALLARIAALEAELAALRGRVAAPGPAAARVFLGTIVDASGPDGSDYVYEKVSPGTEAFFGCAIDNRHASTLGVPGSMIERCVAAIRHCDATGQELSREQLFAVPGQGPRWFALTYVPQPRSAEGRARATFVAVDVTSRREAERAAASSDARFRSLADAAPGIVFEATADGNLFVNRFYQDYTGLPADALLGHGWRSVVWAEDLAAAEAGMDRRDGRGSPYPDELELRVRRHDGMWCWFMFRSVGAGAGAGWHWWGIAFDIHDRKVMEAALRESEARFRTVADQAPAIIWESDATGHVTWFNRPWLDLTGRTLEQELGDGWMASLHPDDLPRAVATFHDAIARRAPYRMDYRLRRADGTWRVMDESGAPHFGADRAFLGFIGSGIDVTEARNAAEALEARVAERTAQLAESEARFRAYFETVEDCLFTVAVTEDGQFVYEGYNPHAERRTGYSNAMVRGRRPADFMPPEAAQAVEAAYAAACTHGARRFTARLDFPAGEGVFDTLLMPIRDASGRVVRILGAAREVTEQVRLEEELRQTQKMQAVGQLTGGVAHDFNNLLTGISGSLELLRQEVATERGRRLMDAAQGSAARGARLTAQLLAFSRRQKLDARPLDLNALLGGMAGMLRSTLGGTVQVQTVLAPGLWPAMADATQIELAVLNVAINARDAMPAGGAILIRTENVRTGPPERPEDPPEGRHVMVAVEDAGTGMPPDVLARVFEPFFTTKEVGRGSGLGLPQVLGVAKQLGGGVRVASRPGQGTIVQVFLPRAAADAAPEERRAVPADAGAFAGARVLLVDDDDAVREVAGELLRELGCTVLQAASGAAAIELVAGGARPDVVLLDYAMPGLNGWQTLGELRKLMPALPVVLATGYAGIAALPQADLPVLSKPFTRADLATALAAALRGAAARSDVPSPA